MGRLVVLGLITLLVACGDDDAGERDASTDAALLDAALLDTAGRDGGGAGDVRSTDAIRSRDGSMTDGPTIDSPATDGGRGEFPLPPLNAPLDYQLGGTYPPPEGVMIVSRDREDSPAPGIYNICYINGYQTQPGDREWWLSEHPDLLLRDGGGDPVIDPDWDEIILDVTTAAKRTALEGIVGGWIDGCDADGFDAIEIDNLDTFTRTDGLVNEDDAVAFMAMLAARSHAAGMAIAQKNSAEIVSRRAEMGTDFVVAEGCNRYDECGDYTDVYGDAVLVIEYREQDFDAGCEEFPNLSIVLRDRNLVGPGNGAYVYDGC